MIFGPRTSNVEDAHFLFFAGQSHEKGRREVTRLENEDYNYKGIGLGYPAVRTTQDPYVAEPEGIFIYVKSGANTDDFSPDNGSWQPYEAAVNSSHDGFFLGPELACAQRVRDYTGKDVYIIKCAFGGTGLSDTCTTPTQPYNWNPSVRYMAAEFWMKRAVRDFKVANPTLRPRLLAHNWWQGEQDAIDGVGTATYQTQYAAYRAYMERVIQGCFVDQNYIWNIVRLKYNEDAAEALINTALDNIAAANDDTYIIDAAPYPQGDALTAQEYAPMAPGLPNADGGLDNQHVSYIGMLAVGELMADNVENAGLL